MCCWKHAELSYALDRKGLMGWYLLSVCPSVCLSVRHAFAAVCPKLYVSARDLKEISWNANWQLLRNGVYQFIHRGLWSKLYIRIFSCIVQTFNYISSILNSFCRIYLSVTSELRARAIEHVEKRRTWAWFCNFKFWNIIKRTEQQ
jgi:hypothetical protein